MDRRKALIAFGALGASLACFAQQRASKVARIGFLGAASPSAFARRIEALRAGLRDLGYLEPTNLTIAFRWADGNYGRLNELAAELVKDQVDVLVTHGTPGTLAAKRATTTIPIVMAVIGDAISAGIVASMARPGGNVTGSSFLGTELVAKRLELIREAIPRIRRVGILANPENRAHDAIVAAAAQFAESLKLPIQRVNARVPDDFESVFAALKKNRVDAIAVIEDAFLVSSAKHIADLAFKSRVPTIGFEELVDSGGLIYYGVNQLELFRRAALFVDKILKGTKPADLPIEQATKFEMVINRKTAEAFRITIPQSVLARADRVIQ